MLTLDDFQYIPVVSETAPTGTVPVVDITSQATLAENFVDETVNISWNHTPSSVGINTVTESKVVVRVFKQISAVGEYATGGWALVDQGFARGNSFSYPLTADMLGDTYKFEVFPYDKVVDSGGRSTYRAGAIQTVSMTTSVVYPEVVTPKAGTPITFTPAERKITFELAEVTNNRSTPLNLFTIIALYDTNGALIDCRVNPLPSVAGNASLPALNLTHTVTLSTDAEYNEVASAKAFVWGGSGFSDTASHIAYATVSSKTK